MEGFILVVLAIGFYFLPGIVAHSRSHNNENSIVLLNLFLGWTVLGWLAALIWSASGNVAEPVRAKPLRSESGELITPESHIRCPECRELVRHDATKCRYCGCHLTPQ